MYVALLPASAPLVSLDSRSSCRSVHGALQRVVREDVEQCQKRLLILDALFYTVDISFFDMIFMISMIFINSISTV